MKNAEAYRMQIKWNQKTINWFRRAAEYTGFYERLAEILLNQIDKSHSLCDLGCGAGMVDFALHKKIKHITCVDKSSVAIHTVQKKIINSGIQNMDAICEDFLRLQGKWDVVIAIFVGNITDNIKKYLSLCNEKVIIVGRGGCIFNTDVCEKARKEHSLLPSYNQLHEAGINYSVKDYRIEFGQPFINFKEAYEYVELYHKNPYHMTINEYLKKNLLYKEHESYPLYLPYEKYFGVFEIRKDENLHLL